MENLPETFYLDTKWGLPWRTPAASSAAIAELSASATPEELLGLLYSPSSREDALTLLAKKREICEDLALLLWNSFNIVFILLQEVMAVYKKLSPSTITTRESTRVCNAIALIQCMATHPQTRMELVRAKVTSYLQPFLVITPNGDKSLEYLRLTSLGVFGALVKFDDHNPDGKQIVHSLLKSEVFPLCIRCMDLGDELTQTVSALIVAKILSRDEGLKYCSAYGERFFTLVQVLGRVVDGLPERPNLRLLRFVIRCYHRLSQAPRAVDAFRKCIPARMTQENFIIFLREDPQSAMMLQQLFLNVTTRQIMG